MIAIAKLISFLFGLPSIIIMLGALVFQTGLTNVQIMLFSVIFFIGYILIPSAYFLWSIKTGDISDMDVTKRSERYGLLTLVFVINIIMLVLVQRFGTELLLQSMLALFAAYVAAYIITFVWKISLHMVINTMAITVINELNGWQFLYLYAILPFVFWSRYVLRKHSPLQLVIGFLLTEGIILSVMHYYGLFIL